ncbi:hypothetical protein PV392_29530 [Streptomyces sp. ME03-5709C]|nr:hypothetical protein [Streptomyces sp. ME03-5709C]
MTAEEIAAALDSAGEKVSRQPGAGAGEGGPRRRATDEEIAAALTGPEVSCAQVARLLRCRKDRVFRIRRELGMPPYRRGSRPTSATREEAYQARTVAVEDGHVHWTGSVTEKGIPTVGLGGKYRTAYRIAFELHHGRAPEGPVLHAWTCEYPRCVAGAHLTDAWMRALAEVRR